MDFNLKMGCLMAILGVFLNFFSCGLFSCVVPWVIYFMFGVVWVLDLNFFCDKYLY